MRHGIAALTLILLFIYPVNPQSVKQTDRPVKTDRELRELEGPVETIRYEWCMLSQQPDEAGQYSEQTHNYVQTITLDLHGNKIIQDPPPYVCGTSMLIEAGRKHNRTYDENGNEIEDIVTNLQGRMIHRVVQAFDSRGNRTLVAYYEPDGTLQFKWERKYDENRNEIEAVHYGHGGVRTGRIVSAYNENGQVIERSNYNGDGSFRSKTISSYEYDSWGNWIKCVDSELVTENGQTFFKPRRVDYRIITYHTDPDATRSKPRTRASSFR